LSDRGQVRGQVRDWVTLSDRGQESMGSAILGSDCRVRARVKGQYMQSKVRAILGSDCRVRVRGRGQESKVRAILGSECRVRVRGRESRTGAWSTVRAIPRARVQGHDQGLGHSNSEGSGVRSQRSGPYSAYPN
jgi:hypothetical protein